MVRSAAAVFAVLILPTLVLAQQPEGTHTVVGGDTLWDLAQRYYSDPWEWRVIWNANREVVEDPNWIYPDEVLRIPGLPGDAQGRAAAEPADEPAAEPGAERAPPDLVPFGLSQPRPIAEGERSIFYQGEDTALAMIRRSEAEEYVAVSADRVYSAPWLIRLDEVPARDGEITDFAEEGARVETVRSYDEVRLSMTSPARVGAPLQIFRVARTIQGVGHVIVPTGVAVVSTLGSGEVVADVVREYDRIQLGDFVRPLPQYTAVPGRYAEEVAGGSEAMIMGFAGSHVLTDIGHVAFLDLGSDDGITIGDEFVLYGDAVPTARRGSIQVIGVTEAVASARVLSMSDDVFRQGVVVRLAKKMR